MQSECLLFYLNWPNGQVDCIDLEKPDSASPVSVGYVELTSILVDSIHEQVYFAADCSIFRNDFDGLCEEVLISNPHPVLGMALNGTDGLFYSVVPLSDKSCRGQIRHIDLSGLNDQAVVVGLDKLSVMAFDVIGKQLFFALDNIICVKPIDQDHRRLTAVDYKVVDLVVANSKLFVATEHAVSIFNFAGELLTVFELSTRIVSISVGLADEIYYSTQTPNGYELGMVVDNQPSWSYQLAGYKEGDPDSAAGMIAVYDPRVAIIDAPRLHRVIMIAKDKKTLKELDLDSGVTHTLLTNDFMEGINAVYAANLEHVEDRLSANLFICTGACETSPPANTISKVYSAGTSSTPLAQSIGEPLDLVADLGYDRLYYITSNSVVRARSDGEQQIVVVKPGSGYLDQTACDWDCINHQFFWVATRGRKRGVFTLGSDEKVREVIASNSPSWSPMSVAADPITKSIFIGDRSSIYRVNYDGTGLTTWLQTRADYIRVNWSDREIFWSNQGAIMATPFDEPAASRLVFRGDASERFGLA